MNKHTGAETAKNRLKVIAGTELIARGIRTVNNLTYGKTYVALFGAETGIFESRPFVTVIGDNGKKFSCHLSRFILKEDFNE